MDYPVFSQAEPWPHGAPRRKRPEVIASRRWSDGAAAPRSTLVLPRRRAPRTRAARRSHKNRHPSWWGAFQKGGLALAWNQQG